MTPRQRSQILRKIAAVVRKGKSFFLSGHEHPDGDTVASLIAMSSILRRLGKKKVDAINAYPVPADLMFLKGAEKIQHSKKVEGLYDVAIIFECSGQDRMGNILQLKEQAKTVINIDHHLKHEFFGDINLIDVKASSNSEQLYFLYPTLKLKPTLDEATALYAGIMSDTGRFQYSNTNPQTLTIAAEFLKTGVPVDFLCEKMFATRSQQALKLLGRALSKVRWVQDGKIAVLGLAQEDFRITHSSTDDLNAVVNYGLQPEESLMSILMKEDFSHPGVIKVSLRSRRGVNVCAVAEKFGGGGHKYASGCKIKGTLAEAEAQLLALAIPAVSQ